MGDVLLMNGDLLWFVCVLDISVLVCSRWEVVLIWDVLILLVIFFVYFFNCDSVFEMFEVQEMLWVLQVVMVFECENMLCSVLVILMMGFIVLDIEMFNNDENVWDVVVEEFDGY